MQSPLAQDAPLYADADLVHRVGALPADRAN
jgi:hypothetical protein